MVQKNKIFSGCVIFFLVCMVAPVARASITVGIVDDGARASISELVAQLNDDTYFDFSATGIGTSQADSLGELSVYDVIVLGDSGYGDSGYNSGMMSVLGDYLNAGGGVVTTGWFNYLYGGIAYSDYLTPVDQTAGYSNYIDAGYGMITVLDNTHPITSGISNFNFSGYYYGLGSAVDDGAVQLGATTRSSSDVSIAYKDGIGRTVFLGGLYSANQSVYANYGLRTGVEDRLLEQAVAWAADGSATVPEPMTMALFGVGLAGLAFIRKRS